MKTIDIVKSLGLNVLAGNHKLDAIVSGGYVSDLLSDVMGNAKEGQIWITLQTHRNILAVAGLKEMAGILLVKNQQPDEETIKKANEEGIPLLASGEDAFTLAGRLYELLKEK